MAIKEKYHTNDRFFAKMDWKIYTYLFEWTRSFEEYDQMYYLVLEDNIPAFTNLSNGQLLYTQSH